MPSTWSTTTPVASTTWRSTMGPRGTRAACWGGSVARCPRRPSPPPGTSCPSSSTQTSTWPAAASLPATRKARGARQWGGHCGGRGEESRGLRRGEACWLLWSLGDPAAAAQGQRQLPAVVMVVVGSHLHDGSPGSPGRVSLYPGAKPLVLAISLLIPCHGIRMKERTPCCPCCPSLCGTPSLHRCRAPPPTHPKSSGVKDARGPSVWSQ